VFELLQVVELCLNGFEMVRGNRPDLAAGGPFRPAKPKPGADIIEREAQLARPSYEREDTQARSIIGPTAAGGARRGASSNNRRG
jgi:hypothetical protein